MLEVGCGEATKGHEGRERKGEKLRMGPCVRSERQQSGREVVSLEILGGFDTLMYTHNNDVSAMEAIAVSRTRLFG